MSCRTCTPCSPTDASCITVAAVLAPCACNDTPATREEGPPGPQGEVGLTPEFSIGTVTEGAAGATLTQNTPTDYTLDLVIPQPPIDVANLWTAVQTYAAQAVFEQGLQTTGGTSTFGGTAFTVTPNATFSGSVTVAGGETIAGTLVVDQNLTVGTNISVAGFTFLQNTEIDGEISFDPAATIIVDDAASGRFPRGTLVLSDCNAPQLLPNRGGDLYQKEDGSGLVTLATGVTGSIVDAFVVNVPVSSCAPQVTPVVTVMVRIGYNFGSEAVGPITVRLWKTAITSGTLMDSYVQGEAAFDNTTAGCIILEGQTTLLVGNTSFFVQVVNNTDQDFIPNQVTFYATN